MVVLGAMFIWDSNLHHSIFQVWWLPLAAAYFVFLQLVLSREYPCRYTVQGIVTVTLGLATICIFAFNDTVTTMLWGAWLLACGVIWKYLYHTGPPEPWPLRIIGLLVLASLLLLPVSVNRVSVILPGLSGQTHFTIQSKIGERTIPGAHHYQSIVN